MSFTCDQCGQVCDAEPEITFTGRELCEPCNDQLMGMAAGVIAAGPDASLGTKMTDGVATAGIFAWLRARRRRESGS